MVVNECQDVYVSSDLEEDEVDGVGDRGVLVSTKVQFLNIEQMAGSS